MLAPTVMPIARSILSARANRTALISSAALPTTASRKTPANNGVSPMLLAAGSTAPVRISLMNARAIVTAARTANRLVPAPADLSPVDFGRGLANLFFLSLHAGLSHDRLVGHQREDQARQVHQKKDHGDFERNLMTPGLSHSRRAHAVDRRNDQSERGEHQ